MPYEHTGRFGNYDGQQLPPDAQFLVRYVQQAGNFSSAFRELVAVDFHPDGTVVATGDRYNHRLFQSEARLEYGPEVPIHSEEGGDVDPTQHELALVVDPLDGSGEEAATHIDPRTGKFILRGQPVPEGAIKIKDIERSSCVVAGVFREGIPCSMAAYAPHRSQLFLADLTLGGTFLNGHRLDLSDNRAAQEASFEPGIPYDFASWPGSLLDPRHLRRDLGREPNGTYAATMQVFDVLRLRSMTSVFTGTTRHDLLAVLAADLAHLTVTDLYGNPINWSNPKGAVYSVNPRVHEGTLAAINALRIDGLPPGYRPAGRVLAEEVLALRTESEFGTEARLPVWQDALDRALASACARDSRTGKLVLSSFLSGSARNATIHDIVVHPNHRRQGLASYAIDKLLQAAQGHQVGGERVGIGYVDVDLGITALNTEVPLHDNFKLHGFTVNKGGLTRDYRHDTAHA
jgi:fructose-1,6-bisphosphatase/inositol monophosphatase family enzyme/GNAT superfamily N-acetyltransferase